MADLEVIVLIATSRILEFIGIVVTIFLMFRGYKARYILIVGGIVLFSILISLTGLFYREYIHFIALADVIITSIVLGGVILYVSKNPEKARDFTPPDSVRCPVCKVLIVKEEEICTMRIGHHTYYFDSFDHMVKMMKEIDFFIERNSIPKGKVRDVFVKTKDTGRWIRIEKVKVLEKEGVYYAYEKLPEGEEHKDLKELFNRFKNKLRGNGSQTLKGSS